MGMKMNACAIYEEWVIWRIKYVRDENRLEEEALEQKKKKRRHWMPILTIKTLNQS